MGREVSGRRCLWDEEREAHVEVYVYRMPTKRGMAWRGVAWRGVVRRGVACDLSNRAM